MYFKIINFALFYSIWGLTLSGVITSYPYAGPIATAAALIWHFLSVKNKRHEALVVVGTVCLGLIHDTAWAWSGLITYAESPLAPIAPLWILGLWALFGTSLNHSLGWLRKQFWITPFMGSGGFIFSYLAAERVGATTFHPPWIVFAILGTMWFVFFPIHFKIVELTPSSPKNQ